MKRRRILAAGTTQGVAFADRLEPAARAGFDGVSIFAADVDAFRAAGMSCAEARRRIADAGLMLTEVEIVGNWIAGTVPPPGMPDWLSALLSRNTAERLCGMAAELGATGISVAELFGRDFDAAVMADAFAALCHRAAAAGLHVALEPVPTGGIATLAQASDIVRRAAAPNGGLLVDSWHLFRSGSSLATLAALPGDAILSVQISDAPAAASDDLDREMVRGRLLPGAGELDLEGFMRAVAATGTAAPIAVEVFSDALSAHPIDTIARLSMQALTAIEEKAA